MTNNCVNCKLINERKTLAIEFLKKEKWTDCSFIVGNDEKLIKAHKALLTIVSPVFEEMLYGSEAKTTVPIKIPDIQHEMFNAMLNYIYSNDIKYISSAASSFENACAMYELANKFLLPNVVSETCIQFLINNVNTENALTTYEFSSFQLHDIPRVNAKALEIIYTQTDVVISHPKFYFIKFSTLKHILEQESLNVISEIPLFNAVSRYFRNLSIDVEEKDFDRNEDEFRLIDLKQATLKIDENHAENLKTALKRIRFLTMTTQEFTNGPAKSNILEEKDKYGILLAISSAGENLNLYPRGFSTCITKRNQRYR